MIKAFRQPKKIPMLVALTILFSLVVVPASLAYAQSPQAVSLTVVDGDTLRVDTDGSLDNLANFQIEVDPDGGIDNLASAVISSNNRVGNSYILNLAESVDPLATVKLTFNLTESPVTRYASFDNFEIGYFEIEQELGSVFREQNGRVVDKAIFDFNLNLGNIDDYDPNRVWRLVLNDADRVPISFGAENFDAELEAFESKGIQFIIGPAGSGSLQKARLYINGANGTFGETESNDDKDIALVSCCSTAASEELLAADNIFRMSPPLDAHAPDYASLFDSKRVIIPVWIQDPFGATLAAAVNASFTNEAEGKSVYYAPLDASRDTGSYTYSTNSSAIANGTATFAYGVCPADDATCNGQFPLLARDLNTIAIENIRAHGADNVVVLMMGFDTVNFVKEAVKYPALNLVQWAGSDADSFGEEHITDTVVRDFLSETNFRTCSPYPDRTDEHFVALEEYLQPLYPGTLLSGFLYSQYDGVWRIGEAVRDAADRSDFDSIHAELADTSVVSRTYGTTFDSNGDLDDSDCAIFGIEPEVDASPSWKHIGTYEHGSTTTTFTENATNIPTDDRKVINLFLDLQPGDSTFRDPDYIFPVFLSALDYNRENPGDGVRLNTIDIGGGASAPRAALDEFLGTDPRAPEKLNYVGPTTSANLGEVIAPITAPHGSSDPPYTLISPSSSSPLLAADDNVYRLAIPANQLLETLADRIIRDNKTNVVVWERNDRWGNGNIQFLNNIQDLPSNLFFDIPGGDNDPLRVNTDANPADVLGDLKTAIDAATTNATAAGGDASNVAVLFIDFDVQFARFLEAANEHADKDTLFGVTYYGTDGIVRAPILTEEPTATILQELDFVAIGLTVLENPKHQPVRERIEAIGSPYDHFTLATYDAISIMANNIDFDNHTAVNTILDSADFAHVGLLDNDEGIRLDANGDLAPNRNVHFDYYGVLPVTDGFEWMLTPCTVDFSNPTLDFGTVRGSARISDPQKQTITNSGIEPISLIDVFANDYSGLRITQSLIEISAERDGQYSRLIDKYTITEELAPGETVDVWYRMNFDHAIPLRQVSDLAQNISYRVACD